MTYQVLARKYRPQTFEKVYAQEHITKILANAIEMKRVAHAYLFSGPRGVGKTSMARIFAKSLNCIHGPTKHPCNICQNCQEITEGISADVIEIDGASNTGVDDIRELQKELMYSPSHSLYKIYIIDEVHMLSKSAFNALLKTLEEPPENVLFVFATTEPHKVLPTIISRCQRFDFKRIPIVEIIKMLKSVCIAESIDIAEDALAVIANKADGGMRDAQSLLDQIRSARQGRIDLDVVLAVFGMVHNEIYLGILASVINKDAKEMLELLRVILDKGYDIQDFIAGLMDFIRNLLLLKIGLQVPEIPTSLLPSYQEIAQKLSENDLLYIISYLIKTKQDLKSSDNPILIAEMSFIKLSRMASRQSIDAIIQNIQKEVVYSTPPAPLVVTPQAQVTTQTKSQVDTPRPPVTDVTADNVPPPSQPTPTTMLELNKEAVISALPIIQKKLQKDAPVAATYLAECKVESIAGSQVTLSIDNNFKHHKLTDNLAKISKIFADTFSQVVRLEFTKLISASPKISNKVPEFADIAAVDTNLAKFIEKTNSMISR